MPHKVPFTICEYNKRTKKYITIGEVSALTPEIAKLKFVEETNWKPKRDTTLFVQFPICR